MGRTEAVLVSMTSSPSGRTHNAVEGVCSKGISDRVRKKAITSDNSLLVMCVLNSLLKTCIFLSYISNDKDYLTQDFITTYTRLFFIFNCCYF